MTSGGDITFFLGRGPVAVRSVTEAHSPSRPPNPTPPPLFLLLYLSPPNSPHFLHNSFIPSSLSLSLSVCHCVVREKPSFLYGRERKEFNAESKAQIPPRYEKNNNRIPMKYYPTASRPLLLTVF